MGQCKDYKEVTAADIHEAVDTFKKGKWADSLRFDFFTTASLLDTKVIEAIRTQTEALGKEIPPIEFEAWGRERLSRELKTKPDLVVDFFGPYWAQEFIPGLKVAAFPAPATAPAVSDLKLSYAHGTPWLTGSLRNVRVGFMMENVSEIPAHNVVCEMNQWRWRAVGEAQPKAVLTINKLAITQDDGTVSRKAIRIAPGGRSIAYICFVRRDELVFIDGMEEHEFAEAGQLSIDARLTWTNKAGTSGSCKTFTVDVFRRSQEDWRDMESLKYFAVRLLA